MYISFLFVEMQVKLFITLKTVTLECKKLSAYELQQEQLSFAKERLLYMYWYIKINCSFLN